jgi:hypothetical protein
MRWSKVLFFLFLFLLPCLAFAQEGDGKIPTFKDTLDGKMDLSRFLIEFNGFIPIVTIITEPAVGGFGAGIGPVFLTQKKIPGYSGYVAPDITAAFAMYTVNDSWGGFAFRQGSFPKQGIKYRVAGGYASINLSFYHEFEAAGEQQFDFNIKMVPLLINVSKRISKSDVYLGLKYTFMNNQLTPDFSESLPDFINEEDLKSMTSSPGLFLDWDKRNTIFTPDTGFQLNAGYQQDDNWTGSDFTFGRFNELAVFFWPLKDNWICGLRFEGLQATQDPPFYMLPFINLRGIPVMRYQGRQTYVIETEQRFDLTGRWSLVGFAGYGKAIGENQSFSDGQNVFNVGTGFRYLIARVFKMRAGIDVAAGPDSWGWYINFGHAWNR